MKTMKLKRAMLMLTLMVMSISAVTGGTIAWFTDSVTSNTNVISAGNLDVELEYWNGTGYTKVNTNTKLFNENALWEPGYAEVAYLKVSNEGNLQLKYQLGVNVTDEHEGKTKDGDAIKLSDHLVFKAVEITEGQVGQYTRESAMAAAGTEKGFETYNGVTKVLDVKGSNNAADYMALIIYMPTSVGNEANHNGTDIPSITFGVNLEATQKDAEEDSFGPDYDEGAWADSFKVTNGSELAAAVAAIEEGGVIEVLADLTLTEGMSSGGTWYEGLFYEGDKSFTIDLNGHTITNDDSSNINDYLLFLKNTGNKPNTITIKNGTLDATSKVYCAICTASSSTQKITINLENVNLIGNNSDGAVAKIRAGAELNVKAGTVITGKNNYVGIESWNATVNIYDGAEIYQKGTSSYMGSLVGASGNGTVNVYGGKGKSAKGGFIAMTSGGTINVYGGEWTANNDGTYANSNESVLIAQSSNRAKSIVNVSGGTFKGGYNCYGDAAGDAQINISGGSFNADPSTNVASGYKAVNTNGTWSIEREYTQVTAPSTDKTTNGAALANAIENSNGNAFLKLNAGEYKMPSIGDSKKVTIVGTKDTVIDVTMGAYLENSKVSFEGVTIKGSTGMANGNGSDYAALYTPNVTYTNCTFDGPFRIGRDGATFINCTFTNLGNDYVWTYGNDATFKNCTFNADQGKALLIYSDGGTEVSKVVVENCTFNAAKGGKAGAISNQNCAAIEIDNHGNGVNLTTSGNTIKGEFSGEWRIKSYNSAKQDVIVNGTEYTSLALDGKTMTINGTEVTVNN